MDLPCVTKLSHMVWEGGKVATGGCTGGSHYESRLVQPVLEQGADAG